MKLTELNRSRSYSRQWVWLWYLAVVLMVRLPSAIVMVLHRYRIVANPARLRPPCGMGVFFPAEANLDAVVINICLTILGCKFPVPIMDFLGRIFTRWTSVLIYTHRFPWTHPRLLHRVRLLRPSRPSPPWRVDWRTRRRSLLGPSAKWRSHRGLRNTLEELQRMLQGCLWYYLGCAGRNHIHYRNHCRFRQLGLTSMHNLCRNSHHR